MLRSDENSVCTILSSTDQKRWNCSTRSYQSHTGVISRSGWLPTQWSTWLRPIGSVSLTSGSAAAAAASERKPGRNAPVKPAARSTNVCVQSPYVLMVATHTEPLPSLPSAAALSSTGARTDSAPRATAAACMARQLSTANATSFTASPCSAMSAPMRFAASSSGLSGDANANSTPFCRTTCVTTSRAPVSRPAYAYGSKPKRVT
mmetsp:Transcript_30685/g.74926  ORF Transcript_30685/g.74926 Transcript_30685/m.74926 type:complete len:205 (+) Transcript_30685:608-1222(+)